MRWTSRIQELLRAGEMAINGPMSGKREVFEKERFGKIRNLTLVTSRLRLRAPSVYALIIPLCNLSSSILPLFFSRSRRCFPQPTFKFWFTSSRVGDASFVHMYA
jgi:hypothetical protein